MLFGWQWVLKVLIGQAVNTWSWLSVPGETRQVAITGQPHHVTGWHFTLHCSALLSQQVAASNCNKRCNKTSREATLREKTCHMESQKRSGWQSQAASGWLWWQWMLLLTNAYSHHKIPAHELLGIAENCPGIKNLHHGSLCHQLRAIMPQLAPGSLVSHRLSIVMPVIRPNPAYALCLDVPAVPSCAQLVGLAVPSSTGYVAMWMWELPHHHLSTGLSCMMRWNHRLVPFPKLISVKKFIIFNKLSQLLETLLQNFDDQNW